MDTEASEALPAQPAVARWSSSAPRWQPVSVPWLCRCTVLFCDKTELAAGTAADRFTVCNSTFQTTPNTPCQLYTLMAM